MCAVSQVGDIWSDRFKTTPWPTIPSSIPATIPERGTGFRLGELEREFKELRDLVLQMREELRAARDEDIRNSEPNCEMEDKVKLLKQIAEQVGVSLEDVFPRG